MAISGLDSLNKALEKVDYMLITQVHFRDGSLEMTALVERHDELAGATAHEKEGWTRKTFRLDFGGVVRFSCVPYQPVGFDIVKDHPLLWNFNRNRATLSFQGKPVNVKALVGDITLSLYHISDQWIHPGSIFPLRRDLGEYLSAGFGILASGPENILEAFREVLERHGIKSGTGGKCFPPPGEMRITDWKNGSEQELPSNPMAAVMNENNYVLFESLQIKEI